MCKQRHRRRSQGGTTPETRPQTGSGVAHFSVSEVAQFSMSVDTVHHLLRERLGLPPLAPFDQPLSSTVHPESTHG